MAAAAEPPAPETFEFTSGAVTVSEREAGARVTIRRRGGDLGPSSVVWWASDGTAAAPSDYADLGPTTERFAAGEGTRRIYVPIVGDANREGSESFYVNLRAGADAEAVQRVEIVVEDDD